MNEFYTRIMQTSGKDTTRYEITFHTDDRRYFDKVEETCRECVDDNITKIPDKYCVGVQPADESEIIDPEEHTFRFDPVTSAYPKKGDTFDIFWGVKLMLVGSKIRAVDWDCYNYMLYSHAKECFVYEDGTVVDFIPYLLEHMNNNLYTICDEE